VVALRYCVTCKWLELPMDPPNTRCLRPDRRILDLVAGEIVHIPPGRENAANDRATPEERGGCGLGAQYWEAR